MKKNLFLIAFFVAFHFAQGQESVNTAGGVDIGSGGSVSFSVGQLVYTTESKASGAVVQGIQRPHKLTATNLKKPDNSLSFKAYPNPSSGDLFLETNAYRKGKLVYHLMDMQGKRLMTNPIALPKTKINLRSFAVGTYLIQIYDAEKQPVQTIKIVKN